MGMAGVSPEISIKSVDKSVSFYIAQRDLEMRYKMNKVVAQFRQKFEAMQENCREKLEQVYTAYQKMTKRCQMLEQESLSLSKDKEELQDKFAEKCRQKRKVDEMYDLARIELESLKRSAIQPVNHSFSLQVPDLFSNPETRMDNSRKGQKEDMWAGTQSPHSTLNISGDTPERKMGDHGNRNPTGAHSHLRVGSGGGAGNPSMALQDLILSRIKRRELSRGGGAGSPSIALENFILSRTKHRQPSRRRPQSL